jgi:hypothetical protein
MKKPKTYSVLDKLKLRAMFLEFSLVALKEHTDSKLLSCIGKILTLLELGENSDGIYGDMWNILNYFEYFTVTD